MMWIAGVFRVSYVHSEPEETLDTCDSTVKLPTVHLLLLDLRHLTMWIAGVSCLSYVYSEPEETLNARFYI